VNLGVLTTGQPAQARDHFQKAVAVQEKLVAEFPRVLAYREDLAGSHNNLGNLLAALGQHTDAREHYRLGSALLEQLAAECPTVPAYRNSLAGGYYNLANLLRDLKQGADAREPYQKALGLYERLAAESPTVPEYRAQLAHTYNNLGLCFTDLGRRAEAREQFQKALAVMEKLSAEFPDVPDYGVSLGGGYCNFAFGVLNGGQPAESLAWFDKAIRVLGPIQERNPLNFQARYFLRNCHSGRARALVQLQKFADSVTEWDKAVEFSPADQKRLFRAARATARAHAGAVADAVAEVAELTKSPFWGADQWYDFACVYALASAKLPDREKEYADKAMELLGQAVKAGYKDAAHLRADADLGALRGRDDFKALVAELEKKFPPKLERAPPPREK
jgi:tetratricopeptide (TPR) repeat protein